MKKFEYRVTDEWGRVVELGEEGWELVSVTYDQDTRETTFYLKREIPEEHKETEEVDESLVSIMNRLTPKGIKEFEKNLARGLTVKEAIRKIIN